MVIATRAELQSSVAALIRAFGVTHILGTPSWFIHTDCMVDSREQPSTMPTLKVIALGGERIPVRVVQKWARPSSTEDEDGESKVRLLVTYGVTEACVYQTVGEVFQHDSSITSSSEGGYHVGSILPGLAVSICSDKVPSDVNNLKETNTDIGEIILSGTQIDSLSGYFNYVSHTATSPFVRCTESDGTTSVCYHTGDRGYLSQDQKSLFLIGRIAGAPPLIKWNGIRIDPMEIEGCVLQEYTNETNWRQSGLDVHAQLVQDCAVSLSTDVVSIHSDGSPILQLLNVYCVISHEVIVELGIDPRLLKPGIICPPGPLQMLLRIRCTSRLKRGVAPTNFILVHQIPVTSTGKRDAAALPAISECNEFSGSCVRGILLAEYGGAGVAVAAEIIKCLNLQPCQHSSITTEVFSLLFIYL
jgi:acyl-CoA synthetase (AMP-forming)/AMP-acid ligase II